MMGHNGYGYAIEDGIAECCHSVDQKYYQDYGGHVNITSVYRCPVKNSSLPNSSRTSKHILGRAFDFDQLSSEANWDVANSAYYAGLQEVKDLLTAYSRLGLRTLANVVQLYATQNVFKSEYKEVNALLEKLWRHSIATAHASNDLATAVAQPHPDELFLAGLLHDVGHIVLLQILYQTNSSSFNQILSSDELTYEVLLQFHTLVSLYIFEKWEIPDEFALLALAHHDPAIVPIDELKTPAHILCLANLLAIKVLWGVIMVPWSRVIGILRHLVRAYHMEERVRRRQR